MPDPLRTDDSHAAVAASEPDRDARIEQLLLSGLDHYFAAEYDHAISVWTRVLFLDRSHARARAYIERARSALAERQRESEELLHSGVAAFERGEGGEARRLLQAALEGGAPGDEAVAVLDRLSRLERSPVTAPRAPARRRRADTSPTVPTSRTWSGPAAFLALLGVLSAAAVYSAATWGPPSWRGLFTTAGAPTRASGSTFAADPGVPAPRRGELALARARALAAEGRLRDAIAALDSVRSTDGQKADADRLRGDIQRQLIALASLSAQPSGENARRIP